MAKSIAAESDFQLYTPRMEFQGRTLTITAARMSPQLVMVRSSDGVLYSVDSPASYECPAGSVPPDCPYTKVVTLPPNNNDFNFGTTTLHACGLISDTKESCTDYGPRTGNNVQSGYDQPLPPRPPLTAIAGLDG